MKRGLALVFVAVGLVNCSNEAPDYVNPPGFTPEDTLQVTGGPRVFVADKDRVLTATLAERILRRRAEGKDEDAPSGTPSDQGNLEVSMGVNYQDGVQVSITRRPRAHLTLRPLGANNSLAHLRSDGALVAYEEAYPSVTAAFGGTNRRIKEYLRVPDAQQVPELRYEVVQGPEFGKLTLGERGELWAHDVDGGPLFAVLPPLVEDATGKRVEGAWELLEEGGKQLIRAALNYQGLTYPILIDPSFDTPRWFYDNDNEPPARGAATLAWFYPQRTAVLFGGINSSGAYLNDTYVRVAPGTVGTTVTTDNVTGIWRSASTNTGPTARAYAALAPRDTANEGYLFGGHDTGGKPKDDLWRLQITNTTSSSSGTWTQITPPTPKTATNWPSARFLHGMAALSNTTILLFGGVDNAGNLLKDTWKWNGTTWTRVCESCFPGLYGFSTVPGRSSVTTREAPVVFSGYDGASLTNLVYQWNDSTSTWNQVTIANAPLPTNENGTVATSATEGTVSPSARYLGYGFRSNAGSILFGGGLTSGGGTDTYYNDLWSWNRPGTTGGDVWSRQVSYQSLGAPGPRESAAALYLDNPDASTFPFALLFGGTTNATSNTVLRQTRVYLAYDDTVSLAVRRTSAVGNYELRIQATAWDFWQVYLVRKVQQAGGPVWEPIPGCATVSNPYAWDNSGGGSLTCTTPVNQNTNTLAFAVLIRDQTLYDQSNGATNACSATIGTSPPENTPLCGMATAFPGQAVCGVHNAGSFTCPAAP